MMGEDWSFGHAIPSLVETMALGDLHVGPRCSLLNTKQGRECPFQVHSAIQLALSDSVLLEHDPLRW